MPTFRLPLSGDVTQAINPWNWYLRSVGGQFGLVNVNLGRSADPVLEQQILDEVGSYGRQLGRIGEALQVLLKHVRTEDLSDDERKTLWAFETQMEEIRRVRAQRRADAKT